ncbi:hypothetical protein SHAQ108633_00095 [Shewanella aquimarina]
MHLNVTYYVECQLEDRLKYHQLRTELGQFESNIDYAIQGMKKPTTCANLLL